MSAQQPIYAYTDVTAVEPGDSVSLTISPSGSLPPIIWSGGEIQTQDQFSLAVWFRLLSPTASGNIFLADNQFYISLDPVEGLSAGFTGGTAVPLPDGYSVADGEWHYALFTYIETAAGTGSGTMTAYLDGNQIGTGTVRTTSQSSGNTITLGNGIDVDFASMTAWDQCLTEEEAEGMFWGDPTDPVCKASMLAGFNFTAAPATDELGGNSISYQGQASQNLIVDCATFSGGYVTPDAADELNPGGSSTPFSVLAWVTVGDFPTSGQYGCIFSNSDLVTLGVLANGASGAQVEAAIGEVVVTGTETLTPGQWHHVAMTYDGSSALTLYIDGQQQGQSTSAPLPPGITTNVMFGAYTDKKPGDFFYGSIQALGIWSSVLTADEIQQYMTTDPTGDENCIGYFPLTTDCPTNVITGNETSIVSPVNVAEVRTPLPAPAPGAAPASVRTTAPAPGDVPSVRMSDIRALAQSLGITPQAPVPEDAAQAQDIVSKMTTLSGSAAANFATKLQQNLSIGRQLAAAGHTPGIYTSAVVGEEYVFYYHTTSGPQEVWRTPVSLWSDNCTVWVINVAVSAIGLCLAAVGVGFSANNLLKATTYNLRAVVPVMNDVAAAVAAGTKVTPTRWLNLTLLLLGVLRASGKLLSIIWDSITESWWSLAWAVGQILIAFASMLLTTPGPAVALAMTNLAISAVQLGTTVAQNPGGCTGAAAAGKS